MQQPLLITRIEAATLLGVSLGTFSQWVAAGIMPPPLPGTHRWSRVQIERAASGLPWLPPDSIAEPEAKSFWDEFRANEQSGPKHSLSQREERALLHLADVSVSDGTGLRGVAVRTFEQLADKGLATRKAQGWAITAEGRDEASRRT